MGLFDRIRSWFGGNNEDHDEAVREEIVNELASPDDELKDIWDNFADELDIDDLEEFAHENRGIELFNAGWVEVEEEGQDLADIRREFFELMEAYDISRDEFDWDAWRDWYEDA